MNETYLNIVNETYNLLHCPYPPVAQLVERLPLKEMVAGSSPAGRTGAQRKDARERELLHARAGLEGG